MPVTFGQKAARWSTATLDRCDRLRGLILPVRFGAAAGTLAAPGEDGPAVRSALACELDLAEPDLSWHTRRGGLAEIVSSVAIAAGAAAKIAQDIVLLMQTEVGEVTEGGAAGSLVPARPVKVRREGGIR